MLHKVTKSVGYHVFSQGLQLPCSAIAADPWNIFTPWFGGIWLSHCHAKGYKTLVKWSAETQHHSKESR